MSRPTKVSEILRGSNLGTFAHALQLTTMAGLDTMERRRFATLAQEKHGSAPEAFQNGRSKGFAESIQCADCPVEVADVAGVVGWKLGKLERVHSLGHAAGLAGVGPKLCPFEPGDPRALLWNRARRAVGGRG